jgi:hypothetical protein
MYSDRKSNLLVSGYFRTLFLKGDIVASSKNRFSDSIETSRWSKRSTGSNQALRLIKLPISNKNDWSANSDIVEMFRVRFNDGESTLKNKPAPHSTFLTLKQKRYKRKKIIYPRYKYTRNDIGKLTKTPRYVGKPVLFKNELLLENDLNATKQYNMFKKKKKKYENSSVVLSRRILRTKRTLVLPAHVNLTAITNSYDVIHS